MKLTIRKKMLAMATVVLVGLGMVSGLSFRTNTEIERTFAELERRSAEIATLDRMEMNLLELRLGVMELLDGHSSGVFAEEEKQRIETASSQLRQSAQSLGEMTDGPRELQLAQALQRDIAAITASAAELIQLVKAGASGEQIDAVDHGLDQTGAASAEKLTTFSAEIRAEVNAAKAAMDASMVTAARLTWVVGLATLAILGVAFALFARGIIGPLKRPGRCFRASKGGTSIAAST